MGLDLTKLTPPDEKKIPLPPPFPEVTRFSIRGLQDTKENLKATIEQQELDAGLKDFLLAEIDAVTTNAAKIDLHAIDHPGGGLNIHLTIKAISLGGANDTFFVRKAPLT